MNLMSRTVRHLPQNRTGLRHPHTQNEQRQLRGLEADVKANDYTINPVNRLHRRLVTSFDDLKASSFAESFFDD